MAEIEENTIGVIERFALLCNGIEEIYPNGKGVLVYELNKDDFSRCCCCFIFRFAKVTTESIPTLSSS